MNDIIHGVSKDGSMTFSVLALYRNFLNTYIALLELDNAKTPYIVTAEFDINSWTWIGGHYFSNYNKAEQEYFRKVNSERAGHINQPLLISVVLEYLQDAFLCMDEISLAHIVEYIVNTSTTQEEFCEKLIYIFPELGEADVQAMQTAYYQRIAVS